MGYREPPGEERLPHLCLVLGPTASGKSRLVCDLAKRLGGEIVNMDAMKVYRRMDIGTAKTTAEELDGVTQHLVDIVEPNQTFNVAQYNEALEGVLKDLRERSVIPIFDCGTPLYLKVFLTGLLDSPEPYEDLRAELESRESEDLHNELRGIDPASADSLHVNDRKRVIRAIEYYRQSGEAISARQTQFEAPIRDDWRILLTGLTWPDEPLRERMNRRVDLMLEKGLVEEVKAIQESTGFSATSGEAIGYKQILEHLRGECSLEDAVERVKTKTWQFSRKQMTWFKRHENVHWLKVQSDTEIDRAALFLADELTENDHTDSVTVDKDRSAK